MLKQRLVCFQFKTMVCLLSLLLIISSISFAQDKITVNGNVISEVNTPIAGVSVQVKGSSTGTITDSKGKFSILVTKGSSLVFSFVGLQDETVKITDAQSASRIQMFPKTSALNEVLVVGYGTTRKSDLTGSVSSISKEKLEKVPTTTFDLKLQGRVAGVNVTQTSAEPNGGVSIRIRGSNSISADNEPLYVVDGYPLSSGGEANGDGFGQSANPLSGINPNDIESIQVLKDASATAIYGSRGSNGVVIITTKRGADRLPTIELSSRVSMSNISNVFDMMNARDYAQIRNDFSLAEGLPILYNGSSPRLPTPEQAGIGTNWVDQIVRTGISQNHQITINGGSKAVRYNISGNYFADNGIVKNSNFNRSNLRANIDNIISPKLTIRTTLNITTSKYDRVQPGQGGILTNSDPINLALRSNPIFPADASLTGPFGGTQNSEADGGFFNNPLLLLQDKKDETANQDYLASIQGVYKISDALELNLRGGTTIRNSARQIYFPKSTGQGFLTNGDARSNSFSFRDDVFESYLKYNKLFNKNNKIDLTGGFSYQGNTSLATNVRVTTFPNDILGFDALQFGTAYYSTPTSKIFRTLQSFYVRANYDLLNKYLFTFTGRADGSSVFAQNNKWGYFPSGAVAWRVSEESFFPKNNIISNLKLRASYGIVGNQAIPPLGSLARLGNANYNINNQLISGVAPASLGNPNLKWETTKQTDLGGDFEFLNGKINLTVDVYKKVTSDLLQTVQLPLSSGFTTSLANLGSIENKGLEFEISSDILKQKSVTWSSAFNISFNRSKILDLGVNKQIFSPGAGSNFLSSPTNVMQVGQPFAMYFGLKALRLIQTSDLATTFPTFNGGRIPGQWLYEDFNKDGRINDADRQIIGNPNPDFILGFNNDFGYKNFQLSVFIQGVYGNDIMNVNNAFIRTGYAPGNKTQDWFNNRWTSSNPTNDIRYPGYNTAQAALVSGNYYVEDGSFIRLKNVTLTYNIPTNKSKVSNLIKSSSVFVSGTNLITLTNYSGFDPEVGIFGRDNQNPGIDFGGYPRSRILDLGVKLIF